MLHREEGGRLSVMLSPAFEDIVAAREFIAPYLPKILSSG